MLFLMRQSHFPLVGIDVMAITHIVKITIFASLLCFIFTSAHNTFRLEYHISYKGAMGKKRITFVMRFSDGRQNHKDFLYYIIVQIAKIYS